MAAPDSTVVEAPTAMGVEVLASNKTPQDDTDND